MANTTLFKTTNKALTIEEAAIKLRKAWKAGKEDQVKEIKKNCKKDFEKVVRKAFNEDEIESNAYDLEYTITRGSVWLGDTVNGFQKDASIFHVLCLVLYMIDNERFIPQSLVDYRLAVAINKAAEMMGYEDIYEFEINEDGKYVIPKSEKLKKCLNAAKKIDIDKMRVSDEEKEALKEAEQERIDYLSQFGTFTYDDVEDDEEEDEDDDEEKPMTFEFDPDLPLWMNKMHEKYVESHNKDLKDGKKKKNKKDDEDDKKGKKAVKKESSDYVFEDEDDEEETETKKPVKKDQKAVKAAPVNVPAVVPQQQATQQVAPVQQYPTTPQNPTDIFMGPNPITGAPAHYAPLTGMNPSMMPQQPVYQQQVVNPTPVAFENFSDIFSGLTDKEIEAVMSKPEVVSAIEGVNAALNAAKEGAKSGKTTAKKPVKKAGSKK